MQINRSSKYRFPRCRTFPITTHRRGRSSPLAATCRFGRALHPDMRICIGRSTYAAGAAIGILRSCGVVPELGNIRLRSYLG